MPDQFTMFTTRSGEAVKVKERGKHYVEPRGYYGMPGTGPEGMTCRKCAHYYNASGFPKCGKNRARWTHGRASDILASSPACNYFEAESTGGGDGGC